MSLFADYIQERLGKEVIEDEDAFVTYFFQEDYVYVEDVYTRPESRRQGKIYKMVDKVAAIAKEKGYSKMLGSVVPSANNSTASLHVLLNYGFKLYSSDRNIIYFTKEI